MGISLSLNLPQAKNFKWYREVNALPAVGLQPWYALFSVVASAVQPALWLTPWWHCKYTHTLLQLPDTHSVVILQNSSHLFHQPLHTE